MKANLTEALTSASGVVVPSFTCYNLEQIGGVLAAAEHLSAPALGLLIAPKSLEADTGPQLLAAAVAGAESSAAAVVVQLDHATDLDLMRRALDLGASAVMADGSRLSFAANIELVLAAKSLAPPYGASVEAELGVVVGDDNLDLGIGPGECTSPEEATSFVEACRPELLAVAVGNVHGSYSAPPILAIDVLRAIVARVSVPLSLHGTSGLPDDQVRTALRCGVRKFNVNTELRRAFVREARSLFADRSDESNDLLERMRKLAAATQLATVPFFHLALASRTNAFGATHAEDA